MDIGEGMSDGSWRKAEREKMEEPRKFQAWCVLYRSAIGELELAGNPRGELNGEVFDRDLVLDQEVVAACWLRLEGEIELSRFSGHREIPIDVSRCQTSMMDEDVTRS